VGAVVLKRLQDAEKDNDLIYGVILGSGINQDGRTNGITAPSVHSQIELERAIYSKYKIDPESISYVETHGTGTKLGDPIELEALATAFRDKTTKTGFCALGSVKSNIGHTSAAAGIAGLQKVLLSMRHRTLVASLNVTRENSHFDFKNSPFYVSREKHTWYTAPGSLRRAAVSSFGFSGTNAHMVIEEYSPVSVESLPSGENATVIVPLSARGEEQLRQRARDLLEFIRGPRKWTHQAAHLTGTKPMDLAAVAYTLQVGRDAMEERIGFVVSSIDQLAERLNAYINGDKDIEDAYYGRVDPNGEGMATIGGDDDMQEAIDKWIARKKLSKLLDLWTKGLSFDWSKLYGNPTPRRISLHTYPFAKEHYWIDEIPERTADKRTGVGGNMKAIEDIINRIDDNTIEAERGVEVLRMLV
jgi:acyl transferase domain-containing protein